MSLMKYRLKIGSTNEHNRLDAEPVRFECSSLLMSKIIAIAIYRGNRIDDKNVGVLEYAPLHFDGEIDWKYVDTCHMINKDEVVWSIR